MVSNTREKEEKQEAPPRSFREQGNMAINFLVAWEQKENKTGNTGTKAYFRQQGTPKSKKYFQGTREVRERNTRKYLPSLGRPLGYPPSCRSRLERLHSFSPTFLSLKYPWGDPVRGTLNNIKAG